jgi:hypothetical protein
MKWSVPAFVAEYGFDKDLSEVLIGWAKELGKRHPIGVLMSEALGEEEDAAAPAVGPMEAPPAPYRITEEGGRKKMIGKGEPESRAEKFQRYIDDLQEKVESSEFHAQMAESNARNLEIQVNKRPYADNQGLKKMMSARQQEAKRHTQTAEKARAEFSGIKIKQGEMENEMAKQYQLNKTKQLDTAFDALDQYWKTSVKLDDGDERFVQYGIGMLLPYLDQFQQMGEYGTKEETVESLRQTLSNSYDEGPAGYQWLKLMLQQSR